MGSTEDVGREGREALVGDLLQPWGQDRGTGFRGTEKKRIMSVGSLPVLLTGRVCAK